MEIETTISITPDNPKHKEYWLICFRAKQAIPFLNKISNDIVTGKLYPDKEKAAVIVGWSWR